MKTMLKMYGAVAVALMLSLQAGYVSADMTRLNVKDNFNFATSKTITVNIQVQTPDGGPVGLSFYSEGKKGLRLLGSTLTDSAGHYQGQLDVPAALKAVVVKSRWTNDFKKIRMVIKKNTVAKTIVYKLKPAKLK
ncbi:MAG: hypothetical protein NTV43_05275 [Methylococcales bacterium]|nr:hypothetical protein [Methylococcales bacterium]